MTYPVALTIAGSDPSGGAGLQADLKTFHQLGAYGTAVITLLTVQNTRGVQRVHLVDPDLVGQQMDAVVEDLPPRAAKTGALGSTEVIDAVAARAKRLACPLVVDPVMVSKHGAPLLDPDACVHLARHLLPHAWLVTPNAHEATVLAGIAVRSESDAIEAARRIQAFGPEAVLIKGGHLELEKEATDLLFYRGEVHSFTAPRIPTTRTHGTGCTYSAAITAGLAHGKPLLDAVREAKAWLTRAIATAPQIGSGIGPLNHFEAPRLPPHGLRSKVGPG